MKLWIASDLHTESCQFGPRDIPRHDVMVIAGDIAHGAEDVFVELKDMLHRTGRPIVFVPGNHDVFGVPLDTFDVFKLGGVHTLSSGQSVVIGNTRFVGATLWTDFGLADDIALHLWSFSMGQSLFQTGLGPWGNVTLYA